MALRSLGAEQMPEPRVRAARLTVELVREPCGRSDRHQGRRPVLKDLQVADHGLDR